MFNVILFGAPGSGKGTQASTLIAKHGLTDITPGNLLRDCIKDPNHKYYSAVKTKMDAGQLVDIEIIKLIIEDKFEASLAKQDFKGFLFDGFPRSVEQDEFLLSLLNKHGLKIDMAILLDVKPESLIDRIVNRFTCLDCGEVYNIKTKNVKQDGICDKCGSSSFSKRSDDNEETIRKRLEVFTNSSIDVINRYKLSGLLHVLDAGNSIEQVCTQIQQLIEGIKKVF
jgi:adenylate kinase